MAGRKKAEATTIKTREDLEGVFGEYAEQVIEIDRLTVEMEKRIAEIRELYEAPMAAAKETGEALVADLQAWAVLHPEAFTERKSIELLHGAIGFRTCPPKVAQVPGVKVQHTLAAVRATPDLARDLIRVREDLDKDAVLARVAEARRKGAVEAAAAEAALAAVGLRVVQDEVFYAEPKRENEGY